ncbi:MAG: flippase [Ignavibacteriales bacterium]|nr:flippase [Ignavibacteriales bacterium]
MKPSARNLLSLLSADIVRRLLGFASVPYLARILGADGFGAINIGYAVLSAGIMVSAMGLHTIGAREIARGASDEITGDILSLRLAVSAVIVLVISIVCLLFVSDTMTARIIALFSLSVFAYAILIEWYFQGKEEMGIMAAGRISSPALYVLLLLAFVRSADDILWVPVAAVLGDFFFSFVILWKYRARGQTLKLRILPSAWVSLLKQSVPIGLGYVFAQVTVSYPPVVLALFLSNTEVGIFSAASKIVFYLLMVDRVVAPLLLPALTRWQGISDDMLAKRSGDTLRWLILVTLPLAVGGTMLAQPIVGLVFGSEYTAAADVFRVFVWYFFLTVMNSVYTSSLLALGQNRVFGNVMFVSAAVHVIAVTFFTMSFGYLGTAFGVVLAEGITLIALHMRLRRFSTIVSPRSTLKIILASMVMAISVELSQSIHFLAAVALGAVVYSGTVLAMRAVSRREILDLVRKA